MKSGERVGIKLIVEAMEHAPAALTWRELWVLGVLAEDANDETRLSWPGFEGDAERSHRFRARVRCSRTQFYATLKSLADKGVLETVERGHNGRNATYRIRPLARPKVSSVPETGTLEASRFTGHYDAGKGPGFEEVASRFEGSSVPVYGTPVPQSPQISSSLSAPADVIRSAAVVARSEERDFEAWIIKRHDPRSPAWWRTTASNGDLAVLAAAWRATRKPDARQAPVGAVVARLDAALEDPLDPSDVAALEEYYEARDAKRRTDTAAPPAEPAPRAPQPTGSATPTPDPEADYHAARHFLAGIPKDSVDLAVAQAAAELAERGIVGVRPRIIRAAALLERWHARGPITDQEGPRP